MGWPFSSNDEMSFKGGTITPVKADNATRVRRARDRIVQINQAIERLQKREQTPRVRAKIEELRAAREANVAALSEIADALKGVI